MIFKQKYFAVLDIFVYRQIFSQQKILINTNNLKLVWELVQSDRLLPRYIPWTSKKPKFGLVVSLVFISDFFSKTYTC